MEVGNRERLLLMRTSRLIKVPNYMLTNNPVMILDLSWKQAAPVQQGKEDK
jgi:hypothetical protein